MRNVQYGAIVASGLGVGLMVGLSASPVMEVVIAAILAAVCGVTAAAAGISKTDGTEPAVLKTRSVNALPVSVLILGLAAGACLGVFARTRNWLGNSLDSDVKRWAKTGLPERDLYRRLFDHEYPASPPSATVARNADTGEKPSSETQHVSPYLGVLFSGESTAIERCPTLKNSKPEDLQRLLLLTNDERLSHFAARVRDPMVLRAFVMEFLCYDSSSQSH